MTGEETFERILVGCGQAIERNRVPCRADIGTEALGELVKWAHNSVRFARDPIGLVMMGPAGEMRVMSRPTLADAVIVYDTTGEPYPVDR